VAGFTLSDELRIQSGTFRVIGDGASLISFSRIDDEKAGATLEFVPNAAGLITPITSGGTKPVNLSVILDDLTAPSTMTLITGGDVDPLQSISVMMDGIPLTPGTEGSLLVGEYFLAGTGSSDDLVLSVNVESSNVVPEPSTFALAALGLLGLGWFGWRRKR